ncbi:hypothetical protein GCM10010988_22080 [Cnuibacter physcomitrellae]|uniref:Uncharacterized protein n=1 Tax=Cnuibacter physcomitrellae TaxID=1619308 RepID=A0A1X9LP30_9MICO|nr:hypothetical protein [Cnuibacter physcomitrellae]ARJ06877.1 hypothetical protein B5808_17840 [Cnuibacter physcomitrellae]GGI39040.1 hypothetical protein GCM10010988_22080 [Cnuibacter physcomitrellae]
MASGSTGDARRPHGFDPFDLTGRQDRTMPDVRISQRVLIGLVLGGYGVVLVVQIVAAVVDPSRGGLGALILLVVVGAFGALIGLMIHYGRASQRRLAAAIFDSGSAAPPWDDPWALVVLTPLPLPRWASAGALDPGPAIFGGGRMLLQLIPEGMRFWGAGSLASLAFVPWSALDEAHEDMPSSGQAIVPILRMTVHGRRLEVAPSLLLPDGRTVGASPYRLARLLTSRARR